MTAIGKLMAFMLFATGIALMTWSVGVYVQRPAWFSALPEGGAPDPNSPAVTFAQLKAETEVLARAAAAASEAWGTNLKDLEGREAFRGARLKAYAERRAWARNGNPKDLAEPGNPDSGKAFYAPVIAPSASDPLLKLHDLTLGKDGKPKGAAVLGTDEKPLRGVTKLTTDIEKNTKLMVDLTKEIHQQRTDFDAVSDKVRAEEKRLLALNVIRNSIEAEWFYLSTFEVNVYETRATVLRREQQLRARLKGLGVYDP